MKRKGAIGIGAAVALALGASLSASANEAPRPGQEAGTMSLASVSPQATPGLGSMSTQLGASTASTAEVAPGTLSRFKLSWTGELDGQALGQPLGTNYNPFMRGSWPIYVYHTLDGLYRLDDVNGLGLELSAKQDLVHGARDNDGFTIEPTFTAYDPQLWYSRARVLDNSWFSMNGQASIFPAVTDYSRAHQTMLFSAALDTTWFLKLPYRRWNAYFTTRFRPTFYEQTQPPGGFGEHWGEQRERLYLSTGHFLGYRISDSFEVNTSSVFDLNYFATDADAFNRGDGNDDRAQLKLNYFLPRGFGRLGTFLQGIVANPRFESTIVGLDLTINLL
jgi:hypothetical protein